MSFQSLIIAAPSASSITTSGLVSYLQGLFGPLFLGIVGIVALFFLFTREIIRFVQFLVLAVAIAVIFYTPSIVQTLAQGIANALGAHSSPPRREGEHPVDLPTYTSIWRIEKRLYKLYDFRLPMPVPVGQIAVFAAITVPYVILLTILGLPFNHTLFWLYVLPPAVITWLATRPVLESKRLPELISSQVRYLGEPGTWCRMAPLAEKDDVVVVGKVWRRDEEVQRSPAEAPALAPASAPAPARRPARIRPATARKAAAAAAAAQTASAAQTTRVPRAAPAPRGRQPAEKRGAPQWAAGARDPAGFSPAVARNAAPPVTAETAPADIAPDERQAPARPAARPASP